MAQAMIIIILSSGAYSLKSSYAAISLPIFLKNLCETGFEVYFWRYICYNPIGYMVFSSGFTIKWRVCPAFSANDAKMEVRSVAIVTFLGNYLRKEKRSSLHQYC